MVAPIRIQYLMIAHFDPVEIVIALARLILELSVWGDVRSVALFGLPGRPRGFCLSVEGHRQLAAWLLIGPSERCSARRPPQHPAAGQLLLRRPERKGGRAHMATGVGRNLRA